MAWIIRCIWNDGDEDFVCKGQTDEIARFPYRKRAQEQVDMLKLGAAEEFQSISIVRAPTRRKKQRGD